MMKWLKPYTKFFFIFALMLVLLLPQASILDLITERSFWHHQAIIDIKKSWPGEQTVIGPFLTIPYTVKKRQTQIILMPNQLNIVANLESSDRYRGIHKVQVYKTELAISGDFSKNQLISIQNKHLNDPIQWGNPVLQYFVSDQRGIRSQPVINFNTNKKPIQFYPNIKTSGGIQATASAINLQGEPNIPFNFNLTLTGMQQLKFAQLANNIHIKLTSNWLHPSFTGEFLPETREINKQGFTAQWASSAISNNALQYFNDFIKQDFDTKTIKKSTVGVNLIQPVDIYKLSNRSIKYAQLFIFLTFIALILFELLQKLPIHPIQYLLIGLELSLFYLLLISLSEHISFGLSYFIAMIASVGLLTLYFSAILKDLRLGKMFGGSVGLLYGVLYVILQAESYALLMGTLLLFATLALLMLSTRHLDWYQLTENSIKKITPEIDHSEAE